MTLHVALNHQTRYRYARRVQLGPQVIRLRPAPHSRTPVPSYALKVEPKDHFLNWQQDPHGNFLARVMFPEKVEQFCVEVDLVADMAVHNPFDFFLEPEAENYPFEYEPVVRKDLEPYLANMPAPPLLKKWLRDLRGRTGVRTIDFLVELNQRLQHEIRYTIRLEPGVQTPEETLALRSGSCRDTGWLLVQILRHLGIASRFVSGYLIQLVADVKPLDGPSGAAQDFTDLHAWCEAYLPGAGWIGLDPTSGLLAGEGHIPLACTPHPVSAAPITGVIEECESTFEHTMTVRRIVESPRVTKPYSEEQWQAIDEFGHRIERQLIADDVRVTIGGEPTFVAAEDPDAPEWNTAAVGPTKREFSAELIERLRARFAPQGLLHYGQGKWYPGEQLPRWSFSLFWRRDERPLWVDGALIAAEHKDYGVTADTARDFLKGIARRLDVDAASVAGAYEDPWYFIGQERKLPENLDPPRTSSTIRWRARGSRASSSAARASRRATSCPCSAGTRRPLRTRAAGSARRGRRARASYSSCPETRRSGSACRCRRSTTSRRLAIRTYWRRTRSRSAASYRIRIRAANRFGAASPSRSARARSASRRKSRPAPSCEPRSP